MSKLTAKERDALPNEAFALPGHRYPVMDAVYARDGLACASEMFHKRHLSFEESQTVRETSQAVLNKVTSCGTVFS